MFVHSYMWGHTVGTLVWVLLFSLNILSVKFIHGVAPVGRSLFPWLDSTPGRRYPPSSGHSPVDGRWDSFLLLAITNKAAINNLVQAVPSTPAFISLGEIPRSDLLNYEGDL